MDTIRTMGKFTTMILLLAEKPKVVLEIVYTKIVGFKNVLFGVQGRSQDFSNGRGGGWGVSHCVKLGS